LKDKYDLDIDLSKTDPLAVPGQNGPINRTGPCEICQEVRVTHLCHIIPRSEGGNNAPENLIRLCPNHHYLFDRHLLTEKEWTSINWNSKSSHINEYALMIRYKKHFMGWKYGYPHIPGCSCGSTDFIISGDANNKVLHCKSCGEEY
jgi:hypothetical protein